MQPYHNDLEGGVVKIHAARLQLVSRTLRARIGAVSAVLWPMLWPRLP